MADLQTCLKFSVGLSTRDCPCLTTDRPSDYNKSNSGYHLDDMSDGVQLEFPASLEDCGGGSVWDLLEQARIEGINEFQTAFLATSLQYADASVVPMRTQIGDDKTNAAYYTAMPIVGLVLKPKTMRGGVYYMSKIHLTMAGNQNVQLRIYKSTAMSAPIQTVTFGTLNNVKVTHVFSSPIEMPFTDDFGNPISYYFVYERTNNVLPMDNLFDCGCGYDHSWNEYFTSYGGYQLSDWNMLNSGVSGYDNHVMGIQIEGSITCDTTKWMCMSDWDFKTNAYAAVISKVIQLTAINKLIGYLLKSQTINRYTLMSRDSLIGRYNMNKEAIEGQIIWLGRQMSRNAGNLTDCFTCRANSIYNRVALLV